MTLNAVAVCHVIRVKKSTQIQKFSPVVWPIILGSVVVVTYFCVKVSPRTKVVSD